MKQKRGFTLVELLICVFLIILFIVILQAIQNNKKKMISGQTRTGVVQFYCQDHSFIEFGKGSQAWGVHDPDCKCQKRH